MTDLGADADSGLTLPAMKRTIPSSIKDGLREFRNDYDARCKEILVALIITFKVESSRAATFVSSVKALGDWVPLTPTSFLVETTVPLKGIMETLQPMLGPKDDLWVIGAVAPWAAHSDPIAEDHVGTALGEPFGDWVPRDWDEETQSRP